MGFGERREEGWITGFNNRWDHEGEMADESREEKGEVDPQPPTFTEENAAETLGARRANLTSRAREKKMGKCNEETRKRDVSVLASSPSVSPWVTKHDLSVKDPRCDSILAGTGAQ